MRSDRRAEYPKIRKEEDELRLDSWIQLKVHRMKRDKAKNEALLLRKLRHSIVKPGANQ